MRIEPRAALAAICLAIQVIPAQAHGASPDPAPSGGATPREVLQAATIGSAEDIGAPP